MMTRYNFVKRGNHNEILLNFTIDNFTDGENSSPNLTKCVGKSNFIETVEDVVHTSDVAYLYLLLNKT